MEPTKPTIELLIKELEFLDRGGYRLPMGWRPPLVFEDSPICPRSPSSACPNPHCVLLDFVPNKERNKAIPCRHIPLNEAGETLQTLYNTATMEEIEVVLREWLKKKIVELKQASESQATVIGKAAA
jgi:hypothetical protein